MNDLQKYSQIFAEIMPWAGVLPSGFTIDFLGTQTRKAFLEPWGHDPIFVDGAYIEIPRPSLNGKEKNGELWFEWVDWIMAAREARERFVMITLGALYGYQAVGSYRAVQLLNPLPCKLVAVEPIVENMERTRLHMQDNGIDPDDHWLLTTALGADNAPVFFPVGSPGLGAQNCISTNEPSAREDYLARLIDEGRAEEALHNILLHNTTGLKKEIIPGTGYMAEIKPVSTITLKDVLSPFDRVDFLEADIQESEIIVFPPFRALLKRKVHRIHIGTHGKNVHQALLQMFVEDGWEIIFAFEPDSVHETALGSFATNDGILSVRNPGV
jgi:hypothetical protein